MEEQTENKSRTIDFKFVLLLFQTTVFALLLIGTLIIKSVGGDFYRSVRSEYIKCFEKETDIEDVLGPKENFSSFDEGYTVIIE